MLEKIAGHCRTFSLLRVARSYISTKRVLYNPVESELFEATPLDLR